MSQPITESAKAQIRSHMHTLLNSGTRHPKFMSVQGLAAKHYDVSVLVHHDVQTIGEMGLGITVYTLFSIPRNSPPTAGMVQEFLVHVYADPEHGIYEQPRFRVESATRANIESLRGMWQALVTAGAVRFNPEENTNG